MKHPPFSFLYFIPHGNQPPEFVSFLGTLKTFTTYVFILCVQMMSKPQTSGAYVLNKVPVKHRLGHASGNQSDASHLLNQSGGAGEDCQVRISMILRYI